MKNLKIGLTLFVCLFASVFAQEEIDRPVDKWSYFHFTTEEGLDISIDYVFEKKLIDGHTPAQIDQVCKLFINVRGKDFQPDTQMRAILRNFQIKEGSDLNRKDQYMIQLVYRRNHYSGEFKRGEMFYYFDWLEPMEKDHCLQTHIDSITGKWDAYQTLSVQINGSWLVDPISKTSNFTFKLK